jgi:hypothetical protein
VRTIKSYLIPSPLRLPGPIEFRLDVPITAAPLNVEHIGAGPVIWMLEDSSEKRHSRRYMVVRAGQPVPDECSPVSFIGMFHMASYSETVLLATTLAVFELTSRLCLPVEADVAAG